MLTLVNEGHEITVPSHDAGELQYIRSNTTNTVACQTESLHLHGTSCDASTQTEVIQHDKICQTLPAKLRCKGIQTKIQMKDQSTQHKHANVTHTAFSTPSKSSFQQLGTECEIFATPSPIKRRRLEKELVTDPTYSPSQFSDKSEESFIGTTPEDKEPATEVKFVVYESHLLKLFRRCMECGENCSYSISNLRGSFLSIRQTCDHCCKHPCWSNQPMIRKIPEINLLLTGAIIGHGMSYVKVLRMLHSIGIAAIGETTFQNHFKAYVQPAIYHMWQQEQQATVQLLNTMDRGAIVAGDGRADSPGHCAKFGTYILLDLRVNKIISYDLIQSNEVSSSNAMEKAGFIRCVDDLSQKECTVDTLITDRHLQIAKHVRECMPNTSHRIDVWHVVKGLRKKLLAAAKKHPEINQWIKSITHHVHWCASSSAGLSDQVIVCKWLSLLNHMRNIHEHEFPEYPTCGHAPLTPDAQRKKKWFRQDDDAFLAIEKIVDNTRMLRDIRRLSTIHQTSSVEAFNSLVLQFTPKNRSYMYRGMMARQLLAVLHYNENSSRVPIENKFQIYFPKAKHKSGEFSVRKRQSKPTYKYIEELLRLICVPIEDVKEMADRWAQIIVPEPLSSQFVRPSLEDIQVYSRFHSDTSTDITL